MNIDRDLRDALQPLSGDPVADAQAVLGRLGDGGAGGPSRGPKGLPMAALLVGMLAIGIVVGVAVSAALGATVQTSPTPPPDEWPKEDKQEKPKPPPQGLLVMAFGDVVANEPKMSQQTLTPGRWQAAAGTLLETEDSMAGVYVYANDAAIRLDERTAATIGNDRIALRAGRIWLSTVNLPAALPIDAELATVITNGAELMVGRILNRVEVTVLDGTATVRASGGESRRIEAMQRCEIDATGMLGEVADVPFAGTITGWMSRMILQQQDERELYDRIDYLVEAYVEGAHRDAAVIELRRLGSRPVPRLFQILDRMVGDEALLHRTAALIGDLANYQLREWLLAMLERGDEETRAIAYRALVRVTGTEVGDEGFWRGGSGSDRAVEARRWRENLR